MSDTAARLEYLRGEIRAERISWGELAELQDLAPFIDAGDVELLEWAGVPENRGRVMDANAKLARMRYMAKVAESNPLTDHGVGEFLAAFRELDSHLSADGTPPEVWREGPDAPELGTLTCPIHGVVPEQDGGGCRLCDEGEVPDNG